MQDGSASSTSALTYNPSGSGILTIAGQNSYTGATTIDAGTIALSGSGFIGASQSLAISAGATFDISQVTTTKSFGSDVALTGTPVGVLTGGGTINLGGKVLLINQTSSSTFDGTIAGTDPTGSCSGKGCPTGGISLGVQGGGVLTLTNANNNFPGYVGIFQGSTQGSTLALSGSGSISSAAGVAIQDGAALDISQTTSGATVNALTTIGGQSSAATGQVLLGNKTLTINVTHSGEFDGVIADGGISGKAGGSLVVSGGGVLLLTNTNTYTGSTTIDSGTLALGENCSNTCGTSNLSTGDISKSSGVTINSGAFDISLLQNSSSPAKAVVNGISGSGTIYLGANALDVNYSSATSTPAIFSGVISDCGNNSCQAALNCTGCAQGSLIKDGTDALILSGKSSYTGTTTVNSGALAVVGGDISSSKSITVNGGALAGDKGTLPSVTVNNGGTLFAGTKSQSQSGTTISPGTLTISGNLTLNPGANYFVAFNGTSNNNSTISNSIVNVSGNASLGGTVTIDDIGGTLTAGKYTILVANNLSNAFSTLSIGQSSGGFDGLVPSLFYSGTDVFLTLSAGTIWTGGNASNAWTGGGSTNWSGSPVPSSTGAAIFSTAAGTNTVVNIDQPGTSIGTMQFSAGAPHFNFEIQSGHSLLIVGNGIADNTGISSNKPTFDVVGNSGGSSPTASSLQFQSSATAGDAIINNTAFGETIFIGSAKVGTATINNNGGTTTFGTKGGSDTASADSGNITNNQSGSTFFYGNTTAGSATITTNNSGLTTFGDKSTGGNAVFIVNGTGPSAGIVDFSGTSVSNLTADAIEGSGGTVKLGNNALTVTAATGTFSGALGVSGDTGAFTVGAGTQTLSGATIGYVGQTNIASGATLTLTQNGNTATNIAASSGVNDNGTFDISNNGNTSIASLSGGGQVNLGSNVLTVSAASGMFSGTLGKSGDTGGLTIGSGTQTLSGVTTNYSGTTSVNFGTLALSNSTNIASSNEILVNNGTLDISKNGNTAIGILSGLSTNGQILLGANTLTMTMTGNNGFAGVISGTGGLTLNASGGEEALVNTNTYSGSTIINAGSLALAGTGSIAHSSVTVGTGTSAALFNISPLAGDTSIASLSGNVNGTVRLDYHTLTVSSANGTFSGKLGIVGDSGGFTVGGGTETLSGASTIYGGATTIANNATLKLTQNNGMATNIASSGSVIDNGTFDISGNGNTSIQSLSGNGSGAVSLGSNVLTITGGGNFAGAINGTGGLQLSASASTQTLTGTNSFIGSTTINGGTLALSGGASIATSSGVVDNGGTFDISGNGPITTVQSLTGSGQVNLGTSTLTAAAASGLFSGTIGAPSDAGGLTINGGKQTLSGTNNYKGATTIAGGTLAITSANSIAASSKVNITSSGGAFDISGTSSTAAVTSLAGVTGSSVNLGGSSLTLSKAADTFGGNITGTGGLTLNGGTEILSGASNYTGATTINGGTLTVTGALSSSSNVIVSGGTLAGNGGVGNVNVSAGILQAGTNSLASGTGNPAIAQTLTINGNLTLSSAATYMASFNGGNYTTTNVTGAAALAGTFAANAVAGGTYTNGEEFTVLSSNTALSGQFSGISIQGNFGNFVPILDYSHPKQVAMELLAGIEWTGNTSSNWNTAGNWASNQVPITTAAVFDANAGSHTSITVDAPMGGGPTTIGTMLFSPNAPTSGLPFRFTINNGNSLVVNGTGIVDNGPLAPQFSLGGSGTGALQFQGSATAADAGITNNSDGTTQFGTQAGHDTASADHAAIVNNSGGSTQFFANTIAGSATITNNGGTTLFADASTAGSANITNTGTNNNIGTTTFNGSSTAGAATITTNSYGLTQFLGNSTGGSASFITAGTGIVDFSGTIGLDGKNDVSAASISNGIGGNGGAIYLGSNTLTLSSGNFNGVISDCGAANTACAASALNSGKQITSGSLTKVGSGTLTLSGANTYTGATTVNGGILIGGAAGVFSAASATTVDTNGTLDLGNTAQTINAINLAGSTIRNGTLTSSGGIASSGGTVNNIAGGTALTVSSGTTTLQGTNAYTGGTTVNGGTLIGGTAGVFSAASATTVNANGTLDLDNAAQTINTINLAGGTIQNGTLTTLSGITSTGGTISNIAGGTALAISSGTTTLQGTNAYGGTTKINSGSTLAAGAANSFSYLSGVTNNGTLDLGSFSQQIATLSGSGNVTSLTKPAGVQAGNTATLFIAATGGPSSQFDGTITDGQGSAKGILTGIEISDGNTLTLTNSGGNTYSGATSIEGGAKLIAGADNALSANSAVTNNGTLDLGGFKQTISSVNLAGTIQNGTLTSAGGVTSTGGTISSIGGTTAVEVTGSHTTVFTGNNTYSGGTTIDAGSAAQALSATGLSSNSAFTINGTLDLNGHSSSVASLSGASTGIVTNSASSGAALTIAGGAASAFAGSIQDGVKATTGLTLSGPGTALTFTGANGYSGTTTINAGSTLKGGATNAFSAASATTINANGTLDLGNAAQTINAISLAGGTIQNGTLTSSGGITSTGGAVNNIGGGTALTALSGTTTLQGGNSYNGATAVNGGTLMGGAASVFSAASATTVNATGTLDLGNAAQTINAISLAGGTIQNGTLASLSGITSAGGTVNNIAGGGALTISSGTTTLQGANAYRGGTTVNAGTLIGGAANTFSASSATAINTNGTLDLGNAAQTINTINLAGGTIQNGTLTSSGGITSTGGTVNNIGGGTALTVSSGTTTLKGSNVYGGTTTINGGTLIGSAPSVFSVASATTVNTTGTLDLGNAAQTINAISLAGGTIQNGTLTSSGGIASTGGTVSNITGGTALTVSSGTTTLKGTNAYGGGTAVNGGTLIGGTVNTFSAASATTINTNGTLDLGNAAQAINAISLAGGTVQNGALTSLSGITSTGGTVNNIAGGTALTVSSGTTTLQGTNAYTGATTIVGGTLNVAGSLGNTAVTVQNGATLEGTGSISGSVEIERGGILAPGSATPGPITLGSLQLDSGSVLSYQFGKSNIVGGSANSLTTVNGNLTINGGTLNVANSGSFGLGVYQLIDYSGTLGGSSQISVGSLQGGLTGEIQTAIGGQVNLVVSGPGALTQFWDGTTTAGDQKIHGGTGTWDNSTTGWTTPNGAINASWQGGVAVFAGAAGTVTTNNAISYQGLQFLTTGYTLTATGNGALAPTGIAGVNVGNGLTATISAPIVGSGGLQTTGAGTLILSGQNSYSGGTQLTNGVLQVGVDTTYKTSGVPSSGIASSAIGTGTLTFDGGTLQAGGNFTVANAAQITSNGGTIDANGNTFTYSGIIADGAGVHGSLTIANSGGSNGVVVLTGSNIYSGGTVISAGTLRIAGSGTLGATTGITAISGGTLDLGGTTQTQRALNQSGGTVQRGTLNVGTYQLAGGTLASNAVVSASTTFDMQSGIANGVLTGAGALNKTTSNTVTLAGANKYTGGTTISAGTLQISNGGTLGAATGTTAISGGTLDLGTTTQTQAALNQSGGAVQNGTISVGAYQLTGGTLTSNGTVTASTTFDMQSGTLNGVLAGGGALTKSTSGTVTLTGANTYGGGTTISAGTLQIAGNGTLGVVTGATAISGGTLDLGTTTQTQAVLNQSGGTVQNGTINVGTYQLTGGTLASTATVSATTTFDMQAGTANGVLTGNGALSKTTSGAVTLAGANTYTGGTTINAGTLKGGAQNAFSAKSAATIVANAFLDLGGFNQTIGSLAGAGTITNSGSAKAALTAGGDNTTTTFSGTIQDGGASNTTALVKAGTGTLTLFGANTYTGGTMVSGGILQLGVSNSLAATGSLTLATAATFDVNGFNQTVGDLVGATGSKITLGSGTLTAGATNSTIFAGVISDAGSGGSLVKQGTGTLVLSGTNTYTGGTTVNAGTLALSGTGSIANSNLVTVGTGATNAAFDVSATSSGASVIGLKGTSNGTVNLGSQTLTITAASPTNQFYGAITGAGGLTIAGGAQMLGGANTYSGITTIEKGAILGLVGTGSIASSSELIDNGNLDISMTSSGASIASLSGSGSVGLGSKTLTLLNANDTFSDAIGASGDKGGLTLSSGIETLSGTSNYTGATTINSGVLAVTGDISSSSLATVNSNSVLMGTGVLPGVAFAGAGFLVPGTTTNPTGALSIKGNLVFSTAATYLVTINGSNYSTTNVSGTASLNGATLRISASQINAGTTYTLLTASKGVNGTFASSPTIITTAGSSYNENLTYTPTSVQATFNNAVPSGSVNSGGELSVAHMQTSFATTLLNPNIGGRGGLPSGAGGYGPALGFAPETPQTPEEREAYDAVTPHEPLDALMRSLNTGDSHSAWASAYGGYSHVTGDSAAGNATATTGGGGIASGIDFRLGADTVLGFALGGGATSWSLSGNLGSGTSDIFQAGIYGSHRFGDAYISGTLAYAFDAMSTKRNVTTPPTANLTSSFNANGVTGRVEGGYRFGQFDVGVTPYIAGEFSALHTPSYSETTASGTPGFALSYASQTQTNERAEVGIWADKLFQVQSDAVLRLGAKAGYAHDWWSSTSFNAQFVSLPTQSFTMTGITPPSNLGLASLLAEVRYRNGVSLSAKFDAELGSNAYSLAGTGTFRYAW